MGIYPVIGVPAGPEAGYPHLVLKNVSVCIIHKSKKYSYIIIEFKSTLPSEILISELLHTHEALFPVLLRHDVTVVRTKTGSQQ